MKMDFLYSSIILNKELEFNPIIYLIMQDLINFLKFPILNYIIAILI